MDLESIELVLLTVTEAIIFGGVMGADTDRKPKGGAKKINRFLAWDKVFASCYSI